jgi:hypothetical protein
VSMRVLFIALGATRTRAALADAAHVTASGGRAVLMIDTDARWAGEAIPDGVDVIRHADLKVGRIPSSAEWLTLYWLPERAFRLLGGRGERAYFHRLTVSAHQRSWLFDGVPLLRSRRLWADQARQRVRGLTLRFGLLKGEVFDLMVVCDPMSMPAALSMMQTPAVAGSVAFSLASAVPAQRTGEAAAVG